MCMYLYTARMYLFNRNSAPKVHKNPHIAPCFPTNFMKRAQKNDFFHFYAPYSRYLVIREKRCFLS